MTTDKARITVYLPQELKDRLAMIAEQDKRSVSVLIEKQRIVNKIDWLAEDGG